jgi:hypothetical protein
LIKNPSFENFNTCPDFLNQIDSCIFWGDGTANGGSTDFWHQCMLKNQLLDPLCTEIINKITPRTLFGFSGVCLSYKTFNSQFGTDTLNYREAISTKLTKILLRNNCYMVSFYLKFYGFWSINNSFHVLYAINSIGALLSGDYITYSNPYSNEIFNKIPQIQYKNSLLKDSVNWVKIKGQFIAQGNEQYLTISNFLPDDSISFNFNPENISYLDSNVGTYSYYLIDDVSVYPCDAPIYTANAGKDTCVNVGNSITIGTPRRNEYLYWWYDMQGNLLDTTATLTVSPTQTTSYVLVQKDFKFDETRDTVTVSVDNCPLPDYSNLDFEIYPNPCNEQVKVRFNAKIPEGTVLKLYDMIGQEVAQYPLAGTENIATVNLGNLATAIYHATVVVPDLMRKCVKLVVIR